FIREATRDRAVAQIYVVGGVARSTTDCRAVSAGAVHVSAGDGCVGSVGTVVRSSADRSPIRHYHVRSGHHAKPGRMQFCRTGVLAFSRKRGAGAGASAAANGCANDTGCNIVSGEGAVSLEATDDVHTSSPRASLRLPCSDSDSFTAPVKFRLPVMV